LRAGAHDRDERGRRLAERVEEPGVRELVATERRVEDYRAGARRSALAPCLAERVEVEDSHVPVVRDGFRDQEVIRALARRLGKLGLRPRAEPAEPRSAERVEQDVRL